MDFKKLATQYKDELMNHILPFWLECSQDHEYGGYFTCLDRQGNVFDTDKFIWLQGREVWMFSMLYNKVEKRQEWLDCAIQGGEFLKKYYKAQLMDFLVCPMRNTSYSYHRDHTFSRILLLEWQIFGRDRTVLDTYEIN